MLSPRLLYLFPLLFISACATTQPPSVVYTPLETKVPIREKCVVQVPDAPVWELDGLVDSASEFEISQAALVELEQRRKYETLLLAEIKKCQ